MKAIEQRQETRQTLHVAFWLLLPFTLWGLGEYLALCSHVWRWAYSAMVATFSAL